MEKKYNMRISPEILRLLGPNLYTNIYYVLAELIANAWDADAKNVYIIDDNDKIVVEDDGDGMSYENHDIDRYLSVAKETRKKSGDAHTATRRLKMGRKGIGKLSALAVSEHVNVMTIKNNERSGFILSRNVGDNGELDPISENDINFYHVDNHGTSIQMLNPEYKLNKNLNVIKRNIWKMFPIVNNDFQIHIMKDDKVEILNKFDESIISDLASLITIGHEFSNLVNVFLSNNDTQKEEFLQKREVHIKKMSLKNNLGQYQDFDLQIKGWIGTYKTTKNRKAEMLEFSDNFISLYSHGKLGEFNILPYVGQNKLEEVYVVGQLYIDLFEETDLPDMALSNRQGYKNDDPRYFEVAEFARKMLNEVILLRKKWTSLGKKAKIEKRKIKEVEFKEKLKTSENNLVKEMRNSIKNEYNDKISSSQIETLIKKFLNNFKSTVGLKVEIEDSEKKILISHTEADKDFANIIYQMLKFNNIPTDDIIFTNANDDEARIPEGYNIYEYLRKFFVNSIINKNIYVIYITSEYMSKSWGALVEVGASWITKTNHKIFNINQFQPKLPLNISSEWHQTKINKGKVEIDITKIDSFCVKIEEVCIKIGYSPKTREENKKELEKILKKTVISNYENTNEN